MARANAGARCGGPAPANGVGAAEQCAPIRYGRYTQCTHPNVNSVVSQTHTAPLLQWLRPTHPMFAGNPNNAHTLFDYHCSHPLLLPQVLELSWSSAGA